MLLANRGFNSLFDYMFNDPFFTRSYDGTSSQVMRTDIHEKDGNYLVEMELPGYAKEDIKADLKDGYLTITAHKNETKEEKDARGKCIHKESYTGTCNRRFYVGEDVTPVSYTHLAVYKRQIYLRNRFEIAALSRILASGLRIRNLLPSSKFPHMTRYSVSFQGSFA